MGTEDTFRVHCNQCGQMTNHRLVHESTTYGFWEEDDGSVDEPVSEEPFDPDSADWRHEFQLLKCFGCDSITVRQTSNYSYPWEETTSKEVHLYPPRVSRRLPDWRHHLPSGISALMQEVYAALAADSRRLAVMGARAIIDMVITDKVGDQGVFRQKLNTLEEKGFIGTLDREHLDAAFEAGSAAGHRGHNPSSEAVTRVLDIVEHLLKTVYVLGSAAANLKRETPPRPPR